MTIAIALVEAAGLAYDNLYVKYTTASTLETGIITFITQANPSFPESAPNNHPISNWLTVINAFLVTNEGRLGLANGGSLDQLNTIVQLVYRICWCGEELQDDGLITSTQATALLNAYNNAFG